MRKRTINYSSAGSYRNPFLRNIAGVSSAGSTVRYESHDTEEAVVLDVITNDSHPEYQADGYNVGAIKYRLIYTQTGIEDEGLTWALPLDPNITRYPLINEIVVIIKALNRAYYLPPTNVTNKPTTHAVFGMARNTGQYPANETKKDGYNDVSEGGAPRKDKPEEEETRLGEKYEDKADIYRLRPQEGDVIIEGRSGHSIRFGSNFDAEQAPNVLIRAGQNPQPEKSVETPFALIDEDINKDLSSVWLTTDQIVSIDLATIDDESHFTSVEEPPSTFDGSQIILNSNKIIINTKLEPLYVSTFGGTHFSTHLDHTVDAERNYISFATLDRRIETGQDYRITVGEEYLLNVGENQISEVVGYVRHHSQQPYSITSDDKIFIGTIENEEEPLVLGETLRKFMKDILDLFNNFSANFTLPTVGIGPLNPGVVSQLQIIRQTYGLDDKSTAQQQGWLAQSNFVNRESI